MCGYAWWSLFFFLSVYRQERVTALVHVRAQPLVQLMGQASLSTPNPAPRSAAVNESGLIFLNLLHIAYNLGDEIDQENKRSYSILLHLRFYLFEYLSSAAVEKKKSVGYRKKTA